MTNQTPLRIECAECQTTGTCEDCLVAFFTTDRPAEVLPFSARRDRPTGARPAEDPDALPADLAAALSSLAAAGLDPDVLDVTANDPADRADTAATPIRRASRTSRAS